MPSRAHRCSNVTVAIEERKTVRILAIGASAACQADGARRALPRRARADAQDCRAGNVMIVRRYAGASGAAAAPVSVKQARSWTALRSEVARHGR
jgi:hypothetical protein